MTRIFVWTRDLNESESLALRHQGIGGSDAAAVCGADPWKSAVEVYLDKIGELAPAETNEAMDMGKRLKDFIADEFARRTGHRLMRRNAVLFHPEHRFMLARIDRWIIGQDCGLLCKNTNEFMKGDWSDGVPERVEFQCMHYMAVTGANQWWVAALIGGNRLRIERINRDEAKIERLIRIEQHFWEEHVQRRLSPDYDGSSGSESLLRRQFPLAEHREPLQLPPDAEWWAARHVQADQDERLAASRKREAENRLKAMLGLHERGEAGAYKIEWTNVRRGSQPAYRRFRIK